VGKDSLKENRKMLTSRQAFLPALLGAVLLFGLIGKAASTERGCTESYGGRSLMVYVPSQLPPSGTRALVVVLHGGMGSAQRIESGASENGLNMDSAAEKYGFVVAYLNGTPVTKFMGGDKLGWNAGGGCCGQPAENNVDDVGYVERAVAYLAGKYGADRSRIYGMGHSNGAMMTERLMCETKLYAAAMAISGPLNLETGSCPAARGRRILAIHGADDENVPIAGGRGTKGISRAMYNSEERTRQVFTNSGAWFELQVVRGADHKLDEINAAIQKAEGQAIAEKAAQFFGLARSNR
jgi:poly(3-hydroxybutyrate) depolymerase